MPEPPAPNPARRRAAAWPAALLSAGLLGLLVSACSQPTAAAGEASLQEVINAVQVAGADGRQRTAGNGAVVQVADTVSTGDNALARLDFSAGPVVRLSPHTTVRLEAAAGAEEARLGLSAGRLRLSVFGHRFRVVTPLGELEVSGFADVLVQAGASPEAGDGQLTLRCLAGPCHYQGAGQDLAVGNLESLEVSGAGTRVERAPLSALDLRQFLAENPGSSGLLATLTAAPAPPTATPSVTPNWPSATPGPTTGLDWPTARAPTASPVPPTATASPPAAPLSPRPTASATAPTPSPTAPPASNDGGGSPPTAAPPAPTAPPPPSDTAPPPPPPSDTPVPEPPTKPPLDTPAP